MKKEYFQITTVNLLFVFSSFLIMPVLSPFIKSLGYSDFGLSIIFSLYPLSIIIFSPLMGALSDKVGRRTVIRLGIVIEILAFTLYLLSSNLFILILARIFNGLSFITVNYISLSKIQDIIGEKSRGKLSGLYFSLINFGKILGPLAGSFLADHFFVGMPFFSAILILSTLLIFLFSHSQNKKIGFRKLKFSFFKNVKVFLSFPQLRRLAIIGFFIHAAYATYIIFLPLLIMEKFKSLYIYVGYVQTVFITAFLFQYFVGKAVDRLDKEKVIYFSVIIKGIIWILLPFINNYLLLLLIIFISGIFESFWNIGAISIMSEVGERIHKEGTILMTYTSLVKIGSFISFLVSGMIAQFFSIAGAFITLGILIVSAAIILSFFKIKSKHLI